MGHTMAAVQVRIAAITAVLFGVAASSATAEPVGTGRPQPPAWSIGLRLGLNRSTVWRSEPYGDAVAKYGVNGGIAWFIRLHPNLAFQPEVAFSRKGVRTEADTTYYDRVYSYLEFPLLLRVAPRTRVRPVGMAGVGLGVLVDNDFCSNGSEGGNERCDELDADPTDPALIVGGGLEIDLPSGALFTDLRYWYGTGDVLHGDEGRDRERNRVITLSVGYWLR